MYTYLKKIYIYITNGVLVYLLKGKAQVHKAAGMGTDPSQLDIVLLPHHTALWRGNLWSRLEPDTWAQLLKLPLSVSVTLSRPHSDLQWAPWCFPWSRKPLHLCLTTRSSWLPVLPGSPPLWPSYTKERIKPERPQDLLCTFLFLWQMLSHL